MCVFCYAHALFAACDPGYVFVNNQCVSCTSNEKWTQYATENRMYCPGGDFTNVNLSFEQQMKKCPDGAWPNTGFKDCDCGYGLTKQNGKCVGKLTMPDLMYGPKGSGAPLDEQCWTKGATDYAKCMGFDDNITADDDGCGYVVLGRPTSATNGSLDYSFNQVKTNTDLGDKIISIQGAGDYTGDVAVVKAVKSNLANTSDGCVCPLYSFNYNNKPSHFYNWNNPDVLRESLDKMRALNPDVSLNNGLACLLNNTNTKSYIIKFVYGCDASATPNPGTDKTDVLFDANIKAATSTNKPMGVASVCSGNTKTAWKCKTFIKTAHEFYLYPNKTYKDNSGLLKYIETYGNSDWHYVEQGLQVYGKNREGEMLLFFCIPADPD